MKRKKSIQPSNIDVRNADATPYTSSMMPVTSNAQSVGKSLSSSEVDDLLLEVIIQACSIRDCPHSEYYLDSMALSAYADAMRYLNKKGSIKIISEAGRRVIAEFEFRK